MLLLELVENRSGGNNPHVGGNQARVKILKLRVRKNLARLEQVANIGIEGEEIAELECRRLALERQRIFASQRNPIRVSHGGYRREAVERPAQHDRKKARVSPFGPRELRDIAPSEQRPRGE